MVMLCVNLSGLWGARIWSSVTLRVSVRMFCMTLTFESSVDWADALPDVDRPPSVEVLNRTNVWVRENSLCPTAFEPEHQFFPSLWTPTETLALVRSPSCRLWTGPASSACWLAGFHTRTRTIASAFLGLQLADYGSGELSASIIIWANSL